jgi:hypothetical protein
MARGASLTGEAFFWLKSVDCNLPVIFLSLSMDLIGEKKNEEDVDEPSSNADGSACHGRRGDRSRGYVPLPSIQQVV